MSLLGNFQHAAIQPSRFDRLWTLHDLLSAEKESDTPVKPAKESQPDICTTAQKPLESWLQAKKEALTTRGVDVNVVPHTPRPQSEPRVPLRLREQMSMDPNVHMEVKHITGGEPVLEDGTLGPMEDHSAKLDDQKTNTLLQSNLEEAFNAKHTTAPKVDTVSTSHGDVTIMKGSLPRRPSMTKKTK